MSKTGKRGLIVNGALTDEVKSKCFRWLSESISDKRDYYVNFGFYEMHVDDSGIFTPQQEQWKCRALVYLTNWRDAEVGEYCIPPSDVSDFEHESIPPTQEEIDNDMNWPTDRYTSDGRVFEGLSCCVWQRVQ